MRASAQIDISWDPLAAAWRLTGAPMGAAGAADVELGGCTWWFDWLDPSRLVEALVPVADDSPESPIPQASLDMTARLCGDDVARALLALPGSGATRTTAALAAPAAPSRTVAGRLAIALELSDDRATPSWWTVEAAAAATRLGSEEAAELNQQAFDVVDRLPEDLFPRLAASDLLGPLRSVLVAAGLADAELPEPLRLGDADVDERFAALVDRLVLAPARLPAGTGAPAFRDAGRSDRPTATDEHDVDWIDVPAGAIRRAVWRRDDAGVDVRVTCMGPPTEWLRVRLVDLSGRAPVVLEQQRLRPTGTRDGVTVATAQFGPVERPGDLRVELVGRAADVPLTEPRRARRHATNLARAAVVWERQADAEARAGSERALDATRLAARQWSAALGAWESIGAAGPASVCRSHRRRLLDQVATAGSPGVGVSEPPPDVQGAATAGFSESAAAAVREHLEDSSTVEIGTGRTATQSAALASLAEGVGDAELAARFRVEQVRSLPPGAPRSVIARVALAHFARLGLRPPRDLDPVGAAGG